MASYAIWIGNGENETSATLSNLESEGGVNVFAATATLENCQIDASEKEYYAVWGDELSEITIKSGEYVGGAAAAVDACGGEYHSTIKIENGNFTGNIKAEEEYKIPATIEISGGTFDHDPGEFVADWMKAEGNNRKYEIKNMDESDKESIRKAATAIDIDDKVKQTEDNVIYISSSVTQDLEEVAKAVAGSVKVVDSTTEKNILEAKTDEAVKVTDDIKIKAVMKLKQAGAIEVTNGNITATGGGDVDVTIVKEPYLVVEVEKLDTENKVIKLDIAPRYNVKATAKVDGTVKETVTLSSVNELTINDATPIEITLPQDSFASKPVYIKHDKNNTSYYYQATADANGKVSFISEKGFSPFTFSLSDRAKVRSGYVGYETLQEAVNNTNTDATITIKQNETGGTAGVFNASISGADRTITVKNETGSIISVTIGAERKTIKEGESATFTYTAPVTPDTPVVPVTPSYSGSSSSSGNTYSWYFNPTPTPTPVPVMVAPAVALPKTGDMTIWQSILSFFGLI